MTYGSLAADQISTSVTGVSLGPGNATNFKNRIINGGMVLDQRNSGSSVTPTNGQYTLDRFYFLLSQASKLTCQQNAGSVTPPAGFSKYLGVTSSSAYTVGSTEQFVLVQAIEGQNIADLAWGTASAKPVTLSFQVYSSLTGTFGGAVENSAENRNYPFSYSIPVANTWTTISVTIPGDTTGTWLTTNSVGMYVIFGLGVGSTKSGTPGAWGSTTYYSATGATSVVGTNGATFYLTGVQLEVGSIATGFEYRDIGRETILCQRYYYKQVGSTSYQRFGMGFTGAGSTTNFYATIIPPVNMRAAPTSVDWTSALGVWNGGGLASVSAVAIDSPSQMATSVLATSSGLTAQQPYALAGNNSSTASIALNAEL